MFNGHLGSDTFIHFSSFFATFSYRSTFASCSRVLTIGDALVISCITLLFGSMFVADYLQSLVRILSPRYLPDVILYIYATITGATSYPHPFHHLATMYSVKFLLRYTVAFCGT